MISPLRRIITIFFGSRIAAVTSSLFALLIAALLFIAWLETQEAVRIDYPAGRTAALPTAALPPVLPASGAELLIIDSYHPGQIWSDNELAGIMEALKQRAPGLTCSIEYLDCKRHPRQEHFEALKELLKTKYGARPVKVVIAADNPAFEFAIAYRAALFPAASIVFCGVNDFRPGMIAGLPEITGLAEALDSGGTVETALRLHPDTKEVVLIHDHTSTGLATRRQAEAQLKGLADRITLRAPAPMTRSELIRFLKHLPPKSIVLALAYNVFRDGEVLDQEDVARLLSENAPVPVYGVHLERLGHGIVGGNLLSGKLHGTQAAGIALRILSGTAASTIPVIMKPATSTMFDHRQLVRFGISPAALPAASVVVNRPVSFLSANRNLTISVALVMVLLTTAIIALGINVYRRALAEEEILKAKDELEQRVAERSAELRDELAERRRAEDEVRHLQTYLANVIDSMPSMLVGLDRERTVTRWNRQAEEVTGIPASGAVGRRFADLAPDFSPWLDQVQADAEQRHPASLEKLLIEKGGERRFYNLMLYPLISGGVEGTVVRIEDVTERTRIQELMIQTEKMMSVGGLAAGMAHEINNPLGIITQAAQNIERRVSPELPANREAAREAGVSLETIYSYFEQRQIPEFIASIRDAAARASRIIANILRFSRCTEMTMQRAPLTGIMEQALELAANDYDLKKKYDFRSIEIERDYQPDLPEVPVVATEIEQVLLNLLKNAAQAMIANPPQRKPCLVLRITKQERYAVLEVEDNGPGMTEDIRRRVFEPFFTTKEPGVGTGLGLSVSYMIVTQNHKGLMEVASLPGKGARFTVMLPLNNATALSGAA